MSNRRVLALVAIATSVLTLGGCGGGGKLQDAYDTCKHDQTTSAMSGITLADGGKSMVIEVGDDDSDLSSYGLDCVFTELGTSDAIRDDLGSTTALMGRQTESEDGLTYRWSYHPDNGLEMTIR